MNGRTRFTGELISTWSKLSNPGGSMPLDGREEDLGAILRAAERAHDIESQDDLDLRPFQSFRRNNFKKLNSLRAAAQKLRSEWKNLMPEERTCISQLSRTPLTPLYLRWSDLPADCDDPFFNLLQDFLDAVEDANEITKCGRDNAILGSVSV